MSDHEMKVIPKPKEGTASVLVQEEKGKHPFFKGDGEDNYLCGECGFILCENIKHGQITAVVLKCPNCGSCNTI